MIKKWIPKIVGFGVNVMAFVIPNMAGRLALNLFAKPRKGKIIGSKPILDKAQKRTLHHGEINIQLYEWPGNGKKVLLLHGWESNSSRWRNLIESLSSGGYHVFAIDAPGHGNSGSREFDAVKYADFIHQVMTHTPMDHVVAHSVGGMAIMYYLSHYPTGSIEKCVLMGAPAKFRSIMDSYKNVMGYSKRTMNALDRQIITKFGNSIDYYQVDNFIKGLKSKALIIHDEQDFVCVFAEGKMIAEAWPGARFMATNGLGHGYQDKKIYRTIKDFLNEE